MDHVAILNRRRDLLHKILSGEKTIESRWYKHRRPPYGKIAVGQTVYFKDSGYPVTAKATVADVLCFEDLDGSKIDEILRIYGRRIGASLDAAKGLLGKKYCILIFLEDVAAIPPFAIDKAGFGNMAAWICVKNIASIRKDI